MGRFVGIVALLLTLSPAARAALIFDFAQPGYTVELHYDFSGLRYDPDTELENYVGDSGVATGASLSSLTDGPVTIELDLFESSPLWDWGAGIEIFGISEVDELGTTRPIVLSSSCCNRPGGHNGDSGIVGVILFDSKTSVSLSGELLHGPADATEFRWSGLFVLNAVRTPEPGVWLLLGLGLLGVTRLRRHASEGATR